MCVCVFVHYRVGHAIDPVSEIRARTHATAGRLEVVGRAEVDVGDGAGAEGVRVVGPPLVRPVYGALWVVKVWCEGRYLEREASQERELAYRMSGECVSEEQAAMGLMSGSVHD